MYLSTVVLHWFRGRQPFANAANTMIAFKNDSSIVVWDAHVPIKDIENVQLSYRNGVDLCQYILRSWYFLYCNV